MRKSIPIACAVLIVAVNIVALIAFVWLAPSWQLSARNSPQGVIVEVYKSDATSPTYTTLLSGHTIDTEVERALRPDLPEELGKTTFYDETLRPGRWIIEMNGIELDIMERALVLDGATELLPQE